MLPNWTIAVAEAVIVETVPAQGNSGLPVSSIVRDDMYNNAPVKQVGNIRKTIGTVPNNIWGSESRIIPQSTDVGQSNKKIESECRKEEKEALG